MQRWYSWKLLLGLQIAPARLSPWQALVLRLRLQGRKKVQSRQLCLGLVAHALQGWIRSRQLLDTSSWHQHQQRLRQMPMTMMEAALWNPSALPAARWAQCGLMWARISIITMQQQQMAQAPAQAVATAAAA
jgi:hypothetical protein